MNDRIEETAAAIGKALFPMTPFDEMSKGMRDGFLEAARAASAVLGDQGLRKAAQPSRAHIVLLSRIFNQHQRIANVDDYAAINDWLKGLLAQYSEPESTQEPPVKSQCEIGGNMDPCVHGPKGYISTYCLHGFHGDCRMSCKVCGMKCHCARRHEKPPSQQEAERYAAGLRAELGVKK
jgi:hypothetical protein